MKLPMKEADLPAVDERVLEAICLEHHHSILQFAMALAQCKWTPYQIAHVAARWTWPKLAAAVAWERQKREKNWFPRASLPSLLPNERRTRKV